MTRITALGVVVSVAVLSAQPAVRRATNIPALLGFPGFYHLRTIVVTGTVSTTDSGLRVADENGGAIRLVSKEPAPDGLDEIRGEFWDIGRMKPDDPRLARYDLKRVFGVDPSATWPRPGEVTAIIATSAMPTTRPAEPSIRNIVLFPGRYADQKVTVTGQFGGRNLFGDLPDAPGRSRYDFVLRATDAAIWVSGAEPKGKGFSFSLDSRLDTGRWVEATGTLREARGLQWIETTSEGLQLAKAPAETTTRQEPVRVAPGPPPEVVFSAPTAGEFDVSMSTTVRIQFSRDLDPATLKGRVRAHYLEAQTVERGEPTTPTIELTADYQAANREVEVKFSKPLERFRTVVVELTDGILGTDKQPLKPWTLMFDTGGS